MSPAEWEQAQVNGAAYDEVIPAPLPVVVGESDEPVVPAAGTPEQAAEEPAVPALRAPEPETAVAPTAEPETVVEVKPDATEADTPLHRIAAAVETFADRSAAQEELIRRLHERVQELQLGETRMLLKPVISGLVALLGELSMQGRSITRDLSPAEVTSLFDTFALRIENTLENLGLDAYQPQIGEPVNPRQHKVISVIPSQDAALDGTVAAVLRPGFADPAEPKVAFAAQVGAYKFTAPEPEAAPAAPTAETTAADTTAVETSDVETEEGRLAEPESDPLASIQPAGDAQSPAPQAQENTATEGNPQ